MVKVISGKTIHDEIETVLTKLEEFCSFSSISKFIILFSKMFIKMF